MGLKRGVFSSARHGSSSNTAGSGIGSPGPVAMIVPSWTCWVSTAVAGRYSPTLVRSSPSSGAISTRSPATSSFLGGVSMRSALLVDRDDLDDAKLASHGRQLETHFFARLPVLERAAQRRRERDVPGIDVHHLGEHQNIGLLVTVAEILDHDSRAEPDPVARGFGVRELGHMGPPLMQLPQPRLYQLLPLH